MSSVDKAVDLFGKYVNGQITLTWETRQTAEQFAEIAETKDFLMEDFIEYVKSNVATYLKHQLEAKNGEYDLVEKIFLSDSDGDLIDG